MMASDNTPTQAKTLVLCFDGTSNQFSEKTTNVVKFCALLDKSNPNQQMVYYQPGIGTYTTVGPFASFGRAPTKILDLMTACYLSEHVCGGYRFLMETYCPGDRICLLGFSRGAYTARVLAGMLHRVGLLSRLNAELVQFAWSLYKRRDGRAKDLCTEFRGAFSREVEIQFIGVWDSVSSVGFIPENLPYTAYNPSVLVVRHALALDERRIKFRANYWTNQPPYDGAMVHTDVKHVWFAGVHSDVGGGNVIGPADEHALSNVPLRWMVRQCHEADCGIIFNRAALDKKRIGLTLNLDDDDHAYAEAQDATSDIHESMSWKTPWWLFFEVVPMRRHLWRKDSKWSPTTRLNLGRGRDVWDGLGVPLVHSSVRTRREKKGYTSKAKLPENYEWVD